MSDQQSIRPLLRLLEQDGALLKIPKPVDRAFELSAFLSAADAGPALLFEKVNGSSLRVAGNLLSSRARIAQALGIGVADIVPRIHQAIRAPVKPATVTSGRVQDVVVTENPLAVLPVPTFFAMETGPYITAGLMVARDPETGLGNASYARLKILGPDEALIGIAPNHHLAIMARKAADRAEALPFAVVLGAHPAIQLAACLYLGLGDDEMNCAGSLLGQPVELVQCKTIDLTVPAKPRSCWKVRFTPTAAR